MTALTCNFGPVDVEFAGGDVLPPRRWTLVQSARAARRLADRPDGLLVELHCGAGQIGQATAAWARRPVIQIDDDPACCAWAARNARRNNVSATIVCADIGAVPLAPDCAALVLADPPYVPAAETRQYPDDPVHAIDGGEDGLDGVRACLPVAVELLVRGGILELQVRGPHQAELVGELARAHPDLRLLDIIVVTQERAIMELEHL